MTATTYRTNFDRHAAVHEERMARRRKVLAIGLVPLLLATSAAPIVAMVVH